MADEEMIKKAVDTILTDENLANFSPEELTGMAEEVVLSMRQGVPKTENFLQRAIKASNLVSGQDLAAGAVSGGPPLAAMQKGAGVKNIEEGLTGGGQFAGSTLGFLEGARRAAPFKGQVAGGTAGRALGAAAEQGVKKFVRGEEADFGQVPKEAMTGAATEVGGAMLSKVAGAVISGTTGKFMRGQAGDRLGRAMKEAEKGTPISGKSLDDLLFGIEQNVDELLSKMPIDEAQNKALRGFVNRFQERALKKGKLGVEDLTRAERSVSKFLQKIGVFSTKGKNTKVPTDFDVGQTAGKIRGQLGDAAQGVAKTAGKGVGKEFSGAKQAFAKTSAEFPPGKMGIGGIVPEIGRAGAFFRLASGDIPGALKSLAGAEAAEARGLPPLIFKLVQGLSKGGPTTISELIKGSEQS